MSLIPQLPDFLPDPSDKNRLAEQFELLRPYLLVIANRETNFCLIDGCSGSDLVQETFLAAYLKWKQFRGSSPEDLLKWLRTILQHRIFHIRRKKRKFSPEPLSKAALSATTGLPSPDIQLENEEDYIRVLQIVRDMPELQRQIVEGHIERDETFKEIGRQLDMTEDATRKAFHRMTQQIREHFMLAVALASRHETC